MSIKILNSKTVSCIAAGEVVERPASVVKEIIENSLDAGSTQISIETRDGGLGLIRISDNGSGIPDDEIELAFSRHATSKINQLDDLESLSTLGFRGEALPSIAAVAQVEMVSSLNGSIVGTYLRLEDGIVTRHDAQARSPGTTITVQHIFRKVPARLKFLKSIAAESSRIAEVVTRYALAYPEVKIRFTADDKTVLNTVGSGKLLDSILAVHGREAAENMLEVQSEEVEWDSGRAHVVVTGFAGTPKLARSTRDRLSFFVNRRWVTNRTLCFAIEEAYHGLLMQGKHPAAVINVVLPPSEIDVNVHPSKTEIKFRDDRAVFAAVQKAVRTALVRSSPVPRVEDGRPKFSRPASPFSNHAVPLPPQLSDSMPSGQSGRPAPTPLIALPLLRVLGQLACSYIVAEGPDGLFLIDQHAAHERILLEKITAQLSSSKTEIQGLLEPVTLEVEPRQISILNARLRELTSVGFSIEPFGEKTYLIRSIPAILKNGDWMAVLRSIIDERANARTESLAITMACHGAIRAGQSLSDSEMRELIRQLEQTSLPNSCPHGRPTMIQLTIQKLEREFGRS